MDEVDEDAHRECDQADRDRDREMRNEPPRLAGPIEISTSVAYTNVATNVPRVSCVPRSRMKFRSIRGPNCVDASVRVTIVIENTTPTTVMTAAASVVRI
jgi:hypothetical protein